MVYILLFSVKAVRFLTYAKNVMLENDDVEEAEILTNNDIPILREYLLSVKGMLYFIILTMGVNVTMTSFIIFPELYETSAWFIMKWLAAMTNASIILSFHSWGEIKAHINAICNSYNVIMESYDHIKEYEENGNDSLK
jgi:hypothetical protein